MRQTESYSHNLEEIRGLPQSTPEEKSTKREKAADFRRAVLWDNARVAENIVAQLEHNPWATGKDLEEGAEKISRFLAHPEATGQFIDNLLIAKEIVLQKIELIDDYQNLKISPAELVYSQLCNYGPYKSPKGEISLDESYPLALILYVENKEDFKQLDNRTNVGGFYRSGKYLSNDYVVNYPVIVVLGKQPSNPYNPDPTTTHEKGHAENYPFSASKKIKLIWGSLSPTLTKEELDKLAQNDFNPAMTESDVLQDLPEKEKNPTWQRSLIYALSRAKDELLADLKSLEDLQRKESQLLVKNDIYDYFQHHLHFVPELSTYETLWHAYTNIILVVCATAGRVIADYAVLGQKNRIQEFRWVLAQIPLEKWAETLEKTGFVKEAENEIKFQIEFEMERLSDAYFQRNKKDPHPFTATELENQYLNLCKRYQIQPNPKYLAHFLYQRGWITREQYKQITKDAENRVKPKK